MARPRGFEPVAYKLEVQCFTVRAIRPVKPRRPKARNWQYIIET